MISFKGAPFPQDLLLLEVRRYLAYSLSTCHVAALMLARGVHGDHATLHRWVVQESPQREGTFHHRQRTVWSSWRLDETDIQAKGQGRSLSHVVDPTGQPMDFLLTREHDEEAAIRFLTKAVRRNGVPEKNTIAGSAAHEAAIKSDKAEHGTTIAIRQITDLNHIVEQDPRAVKCVTHPRLGCKAFDTAQGTQAGLALIHLLKKKQKVNAAGDEGRTAAAHGYTLASSSPDRRYLLISNQRDATICDGTYEEEAMNDNTFQERAPVREPAQESWGPLPGLDPVEEYRVLAHEIQECFPDATPQHLDRLVAREMRRDGGHSEAVITHAMLAASLYLAGGDEGDAHGYVQRTVYEAMQLKPTDDPALGWGV